jgi:hypothetical protein
MSINSDISSLNFAGQVALGGVASSGVNAVVHPLITIKNRIMANVAAIQAQNHAAKSPCRLAGFNPNVIRRRIPSGLYNGFSSVFLVDSGCFASHYIITGTCKGRLSELLSSLAAGIISAPIVSVGEGFMANRQVNALPYFQIVSRAMRISGLTMTAFREIPFTVTVFYLTPLLQRKMEERLSLRYPLSPISTMTTQIFISGSVGALASVFTTPFDLIKTRVQTSDQPLFISGAVRDVWGKSGIGGFYQGWRWRGVSVGLAIIGMHLMNIYLPQLFPPFFRKEDQSHHLQ